MALLFRDAMQNLLKRRSKADLNNRMTTLLETGIEKQISKISKGFTFLATVGSTAPFIGLFGTVWGIMNSFQSIAISRNCLLYTSDAADERSSVDLGGRRIIKKKI